jgi:hypothetical protein
MAGQVDPIWVPSATDIALARVTAFAEFAARTCGYPAGSYRDLRQCSVARLDDFCALPDLDATEPRGAGAEPAGQVTMEN